MSHKRKKTSECTGVSESVIHTTIGRCNTVAQAARDGNILELQRLIREGKPVDSPNTDGWMPLHEAAKHNHPEAVSIILKQDKVDVNAKGYMEETALEVAVANGSTECSRLLLQHGAIADCVNIMNCTPFHYACSAGLSEEVTLLLEHGADVDKQNYCLETPLHAAVRHNHAAVVDLLLRAGANVNLCSDSGLTALLLAIDMDHSVCAEAILEHCRKMGDMSVVNQTASDGVSPVFMAAQRGNVTCLTLLLRHGADPNIATTLEPIALPLHAALEFSHVQCVKILLPVTDRSLLLSCSINPFYHALSGDSELLQCLIDSGLDVNERYTCASDPESYYPQNLEYFRHVIRFSDRKTALCRLAMNRLPVSHARTLLDAGAYINPVSANELPPLLAALDTCQRDLELPRLLVERGAKVNLYHPNIVGNLTVLTCLSKWSALEFVLQAGAEVDSLFHGDNLRRRSVLSESEMRHQMTRIIHWSTLDPISDQYSTEESGDYEQEFDSPPSPVPFWQSLAVARYNMTRRCVSVRQALLKLLQYSGAVRPSERVLAYLDSDSERNEILALTDSPRSLLHLSRLTVRRCISPANLLSLHSLRSLPLPQLLLDYVTYKNTSE